LIMMPNVGSMLKACVWIFMISLPYSTKNFYCQRVWHLLIKQI
jgi:hypothetical protein